MFSKIILLSTESLVWFLLIISFVLSNRMLADFQTLSPLNDNIKVTNDSEDSKVSSENENSTINSSNDITTIASNSTDSSMVKDSEMIEARSLIRKLINKLRARTRARIQNLIESIRNSRALVNLKDCYDSRYKNMRLNLMEEPIQEILFKYFRDQNFLRFDFKTIVNRIKSFLVNVRRLLSLIRECLSKPKDQRAILGLTSVSFMSSTDYNETMNNLLGAYTPVFFSRCVPPQIRSNNIPESFDWNSLGYVTSAKSQLSCASCFVFAAIATVESAYLIKNRGRFCSKNVDFSEQAVLNCMQAASCQTGGQVTAAWQFMQKNGLVDEIDAPYLSGQQFCNISSHRRLSYHKLQIRDFCQSFYNEEITMQQLILANGPIFVGIDIRDRFEWIHVKGVFKGRCGKSPNHAVIITGWTKNYWIIKNSWGKSWGKNGFLYLPRHTNECGVNNVIGLARLN